jgi:hypothetical protein
MHRIRHDRMLARPTAGSRSISTLSSAAADQERRRSPACRRRLQCTKRIDRGRGYGGHSSAHSAQRCPRPSTLSRGVADRPGWGDQSRTAPEGAGALARERGARFMGSRPPALSLHDVQRPPRSVADRSDKTPSQGRSKIPDVHPDLLPVPDGVLTTCSGPVFVCSLTGVRTYPVA